MALQLLATVVAVIAQMQEPQRKLQSNQEAGVVLSVKLVVIGGAVKRFIFSLAYSCRG